MEKWLNLRRNNIFIFLLFILIVLMGCVSLPKTTELNGNWIAIKDITKGKLYEFGDGHQSYMKFSFDELEVFAIHDGILTDHHIFPFHLIDEKSFSLKTGKDETIVNYSFEDNILVIHIPTSEQYTYYQKYEGDLTINLWQQK